MSQQTLRFNYCLCQCHSSFPQSLSNSCRRQARQATYWGASMLMSRLLKAQGSATQEHKHQFLQGPCSPCTFSIISSHSSSAQSSHEQHSSEQSQHLWCTQALKDFDLTPITGCEDDRTVACLRSHCCAGRCCGLGRVLLGQPLPKAQPAKPFCHAS